MTRPTPSKGFSLIEILAAMSLLAVVALISTGLLRSTLQMSQAMANAHTLHSQYDHSMKQLRHDVWRSSSARVLESGQLALQTRDGLITWAYDPQTHSLTRVVGPTISTWRNLACTIRFETIPGGARIRWEDPGDHSTAAVDLTSQLLMAGGQP